MEQLVEKFNIKHHFVTAYHPQANGLIERFNGTLKNTLTKIGQETDDWDDFIAPALFAYRTHHIDSIGATPAFVDKGRELRLPGQMNTRQTIWERLVHIVTNVPIIRAEVIPQLLKAKQRDKQRHHVKPTTFQVGDQVMIHRESRRPLELKWTGPVTIIRKYDNGTYAYELPTKEVSKAINGDWLKLFKGRQDMVPIVVIEH